MDLVYYCIKLAKTPQSSHSMPSLYKTSTPGLRSEHPFLTWVTHDILFPIKVISIR